MVSKRAKVSILFYLAFVMVHYDQIVGEDWVTDCDNLLVKYMPTSYPITDCYEDKTSNLIWWRVDRKLSWLDARQICTSAGNNADLAIIKTFNDQRILNELYSAKVAMNSWMWIGITRNKQNVLTWVDGSPITQNYRWYHYPDSRSENCAVMLILSDPNGDKDVGGTFWYTEKCDWTYIAACRANISMIPP